MSDPYLRRYHKERARRILRLRRESGIMGGQGRTPEHLHRDADGVVWALVLIALLVALLVAGGAS